jgi:hypothetical protein
MANWLSKVTSISADAIESAGLGFLVGMGVWILMGMFGIPNIGLIIAAVVGSLYANGSLNRRRANLKKPTPPEYR